MVPARKMFASFFCTLFSKGGGIFSRVVPQKPQYFTPLSYTDDILGIYIISFPHSTLLDFGKPQEEGALK